MKPLNDRDSLFASALKLIALAGWTAVIALMGTAQTATAQSFTVLHNFSGGSDGAYPYVGLIIDRGGHLYGTTNRGGVLRGNCEMYGGCGVVFELSQRNSGWVLAPLYSFQGGSDGAIPQAQLTIGSNGSLYGTTLEGGNEVACYGGCGTVFNLRPPQRATGNVLGNWSETQLYVFQGNTDAWAPYNGPLVFDPAGNIYGTTANGGPNNAGTIYELTLVQGSWTETILYSFRGGSDGAQPMSGLLRDSTGNLFGTTYAGGNGFGTGYELAPSGSGWTKTTLYSFQGTNDGQNPIGGLIMDSVGNLFGTTSGAQYSGGAGIYELTPTQGGWSFSSLHYYGGSGGPTGALAMDVAGNLYGTTFDGGQWGRGSVFKLTRMNGGWSYNDLHDFSLAGNDGQYPYGAVTLDARGTLYGTTITGGTGCPTGCGTVWLITPHTLSAEEPR